MSSEENFVVMIIYISLIIVMKIGCKCNGIVVEMIMKFLVRMFVYFSFVMVCLMIKVMDVFDILQSNDLSLKRNMVIRYEILIEKIVQM